MRHLLDHLEILQQNWAVDTNGQRVLLVGPLASEMPASVVVCVGWVLVY
jgi:hypothetical protein